MNKIKLTVLFLMLSLSYSCSVSLLNMRDDINNLGISIVRQEVKIDEDSLKIYISTFANEKKINERILCKCDFSIEPEKEFVTYISFGSDENDDITICEEGYLLQFNSDSSLVLYTQTDPTDYTNSSSTLFLIDINNCDTILTRKFESSGVSLGNLGSTGFGNIWMYNPGSPAKWLTDSKFILATNESIFLYDLEDSSDFQNKLNVPINSSYILLGDSIIDRRSSSIFILDYIKRKKTDLFYESGTIGLKKTDKFLYFLKGWSLYRTDLKKPENPVKLYEAKNLIKNYWIIDDDQFIIRIGRLKSGPAFDDYYYYNNKTGTEILFDHTSRMSDTYLSADKKYFVIKKEIIQLKYYDVLSVFDIESKEKYEFDLETLEE